MEILRPARNTKLFYITQVKKIKVGFCSNSKLSTPLGRTTSWSPKSQCVYGPKMRLLHSQKRSASLKPACMSPVFACCLELFGCCCRRLSQHDVGEMLIPLRHCWRDAFSVSMLSFDTPQEERTQDCTIRSTGTNTVLRPGKSREGDGRKKRDAFSMFALAVDRFVTIGHRTAQFCFGLLMRCLFLGFPPSPS